MKCIPAFVAVVMLMLPAHLRAQTAGLEFSWGMGTYQLNNLRNYTESYATNSVAQFRRITDFPSGNYFGAAFVVGIGKFETGIDFHQYKTESKMEGSENGSPVYYKHSLDGYSFGLFGKHPVFYSPKFQFKAGLSIRLTATIADVRNTQPTGGSDLTKEWQ